MTNLTNRMEEMMQGMNALKAEVRETIIDSIKAANGLGMDLNEFGMNSTKEIVEVIKEVEIEVIKEVKVQDESLKAELSTALSKADELRANNRKFGAKNSALVKRVEELEAALLKASKPVEVDNSELLNKIAELETKLVAKDKQLAIYNGRIGGLNSELIKAKAKISELTAVKSEVAVTTIQEPKVKEVKTAEVKTKSTPVVNTPVNNKDGLEVLIEKEVGGSVFGKYNGVCFTAKNTMEEIMIYDVTKDESFEKEVNNALVKAGILKGIRMSRDNAKVKDSTGSIHKLDENTYQGFIQFKNGKRNHFVFKLKEDVVKFVAEENKIRERHTAKYKFDKCDINYKMVKHLVSLHNANAAAIKKSLIDSLNTVDDKQEVLDLGF